MNNHDGSWPVTKNQHDLCENVNVSLAARLCKVVSDMQGSCYRGEHLLLFTVYHSTVFSHAVRIL